MMRLKIERQFIFLSCERLPIRKDRKLVKGKTLTLTKSQADEYKDVNTNK